MGEDVRFAGPGRARRLGHQRGAASCILEVPAPREKGSPQPAATSFLPARPPQANLWRALATASALGSCGSGRCRAASDARFDPAGAVGGLNVLESREAEVAIQLDARLLPGQTRTR